MEHFIKNIEITNFKSIRHAEIKDCRRVNVFVGYPNVGKSNILEAMSLFEIGNSFNEIDLRQILRFESHINLFYNNDFQKKILVNLDNIERVELKIKNKEIQLRSESSDMFFETAFSSNHYSLNAMEDINTSSDDYDTLKRLKIRKYAFQKSDKYFPENFSKELLSPFGENLADTIKYNPALKKDVVELFKKYNLKYATDENNQIKIIKEFDQEEIKIFPYSMMADTLRRLIFYKAAILSNGLSLLLLEEPEAHVFPPYISQLTGDIIFDKNHNQFFITTHSPFVLNDFMEDLKDDELSIYAVGLENGETTINRMTDEQVTEAYQYGIDLFFNLENYLKPEELVKQ